jgi:hypothetical protein
MKIKVYVVDFETPRWIRKGLAYGVPVMVVLGVATVVIASPVQWGASETLTQAKMNAITVLDVGGVQYSAGPTKYCGVSSQSYNGDLGGYAGAKSICQVPCSSSLSAHMCSADEVLRSAQLGIEMSTGWFATGVVASVTSTVGTSDCTGWESATGGNVGATWNQAGSGSPSYTYCNAALPVLCCD